MSVITDENITHDVSLIYWRFIHFTAFPLASASSEQLPTNMF